MVFYFRLKFQACNKQILGRIGNLTSSHTDALPPSIIFQVINKDHSDLSQKANLQ